MAKLANFRLMKEDGGRTLLYPSGYPSEIEDSMEKVPLTKRAEAYAEYDYMVYFCMGADRKPLNEITLEEIVTTASHNKFFGIEEVTVDQVLATS